MPNSRIPRSTLTIALISLLTASCAHTAARSEGASAAAGTVVVANMGENTATVFDVASRRVLATLPTGVGPHEVAVSHDGQWAVVSNYGQQKPGGNSLTLIDLGTIAVKATIDLGEYRRPHSMAFLPGDSLLAVTSETSKKVLLVDRVHQSVVGSIETNAPASHMLAITADGRRIYTSNVAAGSVTEQDVSGRSVLRSMNVAPVVEGIAVTPGGEQVWVGSNKERTVSIIDTKSGAVIDTIGGFGMPYRMAITPDGRTAVVSDPPKSNVLIYDVATRKLRFTVPIPAEGVLGTAEFPGSASPEGMALSRDGLTVYVALQGSNRVAIVDIASGKLIATMPTGAGPDGIGYSPRRW
jgi:YVTN family beta-propeller protein